MSTKKSLLRTVVRPIKLPGYVYRHVRADGIDGVRTAGEKISADLLAGFSRGYVDHVGNIGRPVWDREWDVLLVLDACRVDLLRSVAGEYPFLGEPDAVGTHWSVASKSSDWLRRTFSSEYEEVIGETAYVTGNPFTAKVPLDVEPAILDEVWRYGWDEELSTIPAPPLTDRAISTWRDEDVSRMIVHYMQPHGPFVPHPDLGSYGDPDDFGDGFGDLWAKAGDEISTDTIWEAYRDNLRYVLDDVELLVNNVDAEQIVLTADHGNAIGEFGVYGHPQDVLLPSIRRVPWARTSGRDTGAHRPNMERDTGPTDVEDRLEHLGYVA